MSSFYRFTTNAFYISYFYIFYRVVSYSCPLSEISIIFRDRIDIAFFYMIYSFFLKFTIIFK